MVTSDRGFTLIEALCGLLVMTTVFVALHQGFSSGWRGIRAVERERMALQIARRELVRTGIMAPLIPGSTAEITEDGFSWSVEVSELASGPDLQHGAVRAFWVRAEVRWRDWSGPASLHLKTVKFASPVGRLEQAEHAR